MAEAPSLPPAHAASAAESGSDGQITFKVKTSSESPHVITMAETATVLDLKTKLSSEEFENIPVERQRLIYSGRLMKNDETLATYKIKHNNTVHMVKSAASNPSQPAAASTPPPPVVPSNMASGTANNPLANLTGARFAGHQVPFPGMDAFGPDGGMGPPMDAEGMRNMLADPNMRQTMNEMLGNPDFINMVINSNPMMQRIPNVREILSSPLMRQMMTNPDLMEQAMRQQRAMQGAGAAFPAPGATDTMPEGAAAANDSGDGDRRPPPFFDPRMIPFMMPGQGGDTNARLLDGLAALGLSPFGGQNQGRTAGAGAGAGDGTTQGQDAPANPGQAQHQQQRTAPDPANPFAMLFPQMNPNPQGGAAGSDPWNMNMSPEQLSRMMQMFGAGAGGAAAATPVDNRPPEERYAEQLRQLNDMGFYNFERNIEALRRSGGNVQGAIEDLLS